MFYSVKYIKLTTFSRYKERNTCSWQITAVLSCSYQYFICVSMPLVTSLTERTGKTNIWTSPRISSVIIRCAAFSRRMTNDVLISGGERLKSRGKRANWCKKRKQFNREEVLKITTVETFDRGSVSTRYSMERDSWRKQKCEIRQAVGK